MSESGREPSQMSGSGLDALQDVQEWLGGSRGCPEVVGRPSRMSGSCRRPSRMSGSVREALPYVRKDRPDVREWSGGPTVCPVVVRRSSQMSGSGREALKDVRE